MNAPKSSQIGLILRALAFAAHKHKDQKRKGKDASPYINHPIAAASLLASEAGIDDHVDHLRDFRNRWVHAGASSSSENIEDNAFVLKRYVDEVLRFHFQFSGRFDSLEAAAAFLDLPSSIPVLRHRQKELTWAISYRTPQ